MNPVAAAKLKMLQASIYCLWFGLLGLLPFIGLPFGVTALWLAGRIRRQEKQLWNAAKPGRIIGATCGGVGAVLWGGILIFVVGRAIINATMGPD